MEVTGLFLALLSSNNKADKEEINVHKNDKTQPKMNFPESI